MGPDRGALHRPLSGGGLDRRRLDPHPLSPLPGRERGAALRSSSRLAHDARKTKTAWAPAGPGRRADKEIREGVRYPQHRTIRGDGSKSRSPRRRVRRRIGGFRRPVGRLPGGPVMRSGSASGGSVDDALEGREGARNASCAGDNQQLARHRRNPTARTAPDQARRIESGGS